MGPLFVSGTGEEDEEAMGRDELIELLEPPIAALGYELVQVLYRSGHGNGLLRLYIDSDDGVTVEACEKVSHQVSGLLDVEDPIKGHYTLEVSSPGSDRPLRTAEHFERFVGSRVKVELVAAREGRKRYTGELEACEDGQIMVRVDGEEHHFGLDEIDMARVIPG